MSTEPRGIAFPTVRIIDETMREGMQIEDSSIPVERKVELLDALSTTGLRNLVVGSFVSSRWVPQMADVEELLHRFTPVPGVTYTALALNDKGVQRRAQFVPPLTVDEQPRLTVHACDVFIRRNTNRSQAQEIAAWPGAVARAQAEGASSATVRLGAGFGSNWIGDISLADNLDLIERMMRTWSEASIVVDTVWLGDPMGWNTPLRTEQLVVEILRRWPSVNTIHLHLHDQRGAALVSAWSALRAMPPDKTLVVDASVGGIGGCPYCGNGRAAGMIPTEDLVDLMEECGIDTGVDRDRLIDSALLAAEIVGRPLHGRTPLAGTRPRGQRLYPMDMPFVETIHAASHFRNGPQVYSAGLSPWKEPITSAQRDSVKVIR
ncbi:citramalate synthase [Rhodococcus sp. OK302]|uniref:citramalate synthase n=1 Tax=Rhodococcus sp. OK302 TaxID=1882769 RepID=UPI000B93E236|nr:citramalate synthase [Rhodococcus sp. OK302]OYD61470.1 hydroxymethylglutaryl-CoA lyase [Rhodococcus sp. OK302]